MNKEKLEKKLLYYLPFVVLLILELCIHSRIDTNWGDDLWFTNVAQKNDFNLLSWLYERYQVWSSRTLIEAVLMIIVQLPRIIWAIVDSCMITLSAIFLVKNIGEQGKHRQLGCVIPMLIFLMPYTQVNSAGWIATTVNYMWPLACGIVAIYPIRKYIENKKLNGFEYIFYTVCLLFSANSEQMCFILIMVYVTCCIYYIINNKKLFLAGGKYIIFQTALSVGMLVYIMICPGNQLRSVQETRTWFPEFADFSLLKKIELGISTTIKADFMQQNICFVILLLLVATYIWKSNCKWMYKIMGIIPAFIALCFQQAQMILGDMGIVTRYGILFGERFHNWKYLAFYALMVLLYIFILLSFYMIFEDKSKWVVIGIFLMGLATKAVMGFSPTVWDSGDRTGWVMNFAFLTCIGFVVLKFGQKNKESISDEE